MANQELVNWIKSEEAKGYSDNALKKHLSKKYSSTEIEDAFGSLRKKNNNTSFSVSFVLLSGLGFLSLILTSLVLAIASLSPGTGVGYLLIVLSGAGIGYYIYHIKQKLNATESLGAILGIFSPTLSLIFLLTVLKLIQMLAVQLSAFSNSGPAVGMSDMVSIFSINLDPIASAALFYLFCNLFVIISIIKSKEYHIFLWYLLASTLFFVLWLVIDLITSPIMKNTLF